MPLIKLDSDLSRVAGANAFMMKRLHNLGIKTVRDLLWHFPARYEDFSQIYKIGDLEPGQQATIQGRIDDIDLRRTWKRHLTLVEATISDSSGSIKAVWFNQPYLLNILRPGRMANFSGKISVSNGELHLAHPTYEVLSRRTLSLDSDYGESIPDSVEPETRHTARLVPIYPETRGLTSRGLRFLVKPVLDNLVELEEWLPEEILEEKNLPELYQALSSIHFPNNIEDALTAKKRFEFEDLFLLQITNLRQKLKFAEEKSPPLATNIDWVKEVIGKLPFELTQSQKKSLWEIIQDLEKPHPMNRLLQGDVGSGKTVVAAIAALIAAKNGYQTAIMAPTEVLANQHFATFKKLLSRIDQPNQKPVGLLTSSSAEVVYETDVESSIGKKEMAAKISSGEVCIIIGTHALIQKTVSFKNLGLVVVDEQHRFGVKQRAELLKLKNPGARSENTVTATNGMIPHFLSMSATPIPRTLMLTIFGDLDISIITELPPGRKNILTKVVAPEKRSKAYEFIRTEVKKGRQVFVICPRIEANEGQGSRVKGQEWLKFAAQQEAKSVKEEFEKLSKKVFPDLKVAMLHGKLKSKEKDAVMKAFGRGETDILVSTSVIEVGIDVPNATIMMIEGGERFGLAQIYQFRGRVGRGIHQSYCFLFTESESKSVAARLNAILEAKNGMELAEKDLKLRGPGEFLGQAQTGLPDYAMRGLQDLELVKSSREAAAKIIAKDKTLKKYPELKTRVGEFEREMHLE